MRIELSDHAKEQIKVRKISNNRVLDTVKNPLKKIKSFRNRGIAAKAIW